MQNGKKSIPDFLNKVNRSRTRKNSSIQVIDVDHPPPEIQALQISNSDLSEYIDYIWSIASVKPPSRSPRLEVFQLELTTIFHCFHTLIIIRGGSMTKYLIRV